MKLPGLDWLFKQGAQPRLGPALRIEERIAGGTYFECYRATDKLRKRQVCVKLARALEGPLARQIINDHLALWHHLSSIPIAGMPAILAIGELEGRPYLVLEWVEAQSLAKIVTGRSASPNLLVQVREQGASILSSIHARGLVHGDLAPSNILVEDIGPSVRIWLTDPAPPLSASDLSDPRRRLIIGTPPFMAPEILNGAPPTPATDLYALDVIARGLEAVVNDAPASSTGDWTEGTVVFSRAPRARTSRYVAWFARRPWSSLEMLHAELGMITTIPEADREGPQERSVPPQPVTAPDGESPAEPAEPEAPDSAESETAATSDTSHRRLKRIRKPRVDITYDDSDPFAAPKPELPFVADGMGNDAGAASQPPAPLAPSAPAPDRTPWEHQSALFSVPVPPREAGAASAPADFSVIAPPAIEAGRSFFIEVWVAPSGQHEAVLSQAIRPGKMAERAQRSFLNIATDQVLTIVLKLPDFEVEDRIKHLGWNGDIRNVGFMAKAPQQLRPGTYPGMVELLQAKTPFASISFDLQITMGDVALPVEQTALETRVRRITQAFASYASEDRGEVLRRVQGIHAVGVDVFLDIVNLRAGEQWEKVLYREIGAAHAFYLFWSRRAKESPWVEKEWRYALDQRGEDFINPLPLEDPRLASPPPELKSKHFNDPWLAHLAYDALMAARRE